MGRWWKESWSRLFNKSSELLIRRFIRTAKDQSSSRHKNDVKIIKQENTEPSVLSEVMKKIYLKINKLKYYVKNVNNDEELKLERQLNVS